MTRDEELLLAYACTDAVSLCRTLFHLQENSVAGIGLGHIHAVTGVRDKLLEEWAAIYDLASTGQAEVIQHLNDWILANYSEVTQVVRAYGFS